MKKQLLNLIIRIILTNILYGGDLGQRTYTFNHNAICKVNSSPFWFGYVEGKEVIWGLFSKNLISGDSFEGMTELEQRILLSILAREDAGHILIKKQSASRLATYPSEKKPFFGQGVIPYRTIKELADGFKKCNQCVIGPLWPVVIKNLREFQTEQKMLADYKHAFANPEEPVSSELFFPIAMLDLSPDMFKTEFENQVFPNFSAECPAGFIGVDMKKSPNLPVLLARLGPMLCGYSKADGMNHVLVQVTSDTTLPEILNSLCGGSPKQYLQRPNLARQELYTDQSSSIVRAGKWLDLKWNSSRNKITPSFRGPHNKYRELGPIIANFCIREDPRYIDAKIAISTQECNPYTLSYENVLRLLDNASVNSYIGDSETPWQYVPDDPDSAESQDETDGLNLDLSKSSKEEIERIAKEELGRINPEQIHRNIMLLKALGITYKNTTEEILKILCLKDPFMVANVDGFFQKIKELEIFIKTELEQNFGESGELNAEEFKVISNKMDRIFCPIIEYAKLIAKHMLKVHIGPDPRMLSDKDLAVKIFYVQEALRLMDPPLKKIIKKLKNYGIHWNTAIEQPRFKIRSEVSFRFLGKILEEVIKFIRTDPINPDKIQLTRELGQIFNDMSRENPVFKIIFMNKEHFAFTDGDLIRMPCKLTLNGSIKK